MDNTMEQTATNVKRAIAKPWIAAVAIIALGAGVTGCSKDDNKSDSKPAVQTTVASSDNAGGDTTDQTMPELIPNVEGHISMTSAESKLLKVGPDEERTYGWNKLVGPTKTQIGDFDVEMLGNVDYLQGNGSFFGFFTYTASSGDSFGMRMAGQASVNEDGSSTLHAELDIIGGTGAYVNVTGSGSFDGSREAVVGAPIEIDVKLALDGIDD